MAEERERPDRKVRSFVQFRIRKLQASSNESYVNQSLALLRRGVGKSPGSSPDLWSLTLEGLDDDLMSKDGNPTSSEWAIHTALTLFAMHQQGVPIQTDCVNDETTSFGQAVGRLIEDENDIPRIRRRFNMALTASTPIEFAQHVRGLIQLMKAHGISLNYPALASDLFWFSYVQHRDRVRLRWGQDFYISMSHLATKEE